MAIMQNVSKNIIIALFICLSLTTLAGCGSLLLSLMEATSQEASPETPDPLILDATPAPAPEATPDPHPPASPAQIRDPSPAPTPDTAFEHSKQWKQAVFDRTRSFHAEMLQRLPDKREYFGDIWEYPEYDYELALHDLGFAAPYVTITDMSYDFVLTEETLYGIENGRLNEIVTSQWMEIYKHLSSGISDKMSATWTGGGTWSETFFYQYENGEWVKLGYTFTTDGGWYFHDEATGEQGEGEEAERLLDERLEGYQYIPLEDWFRQTFTYVGENGNIIPWEDMAPAVSAYLDAYDGIAVGLE